VSARDRNRDLLEILIPTRYQRARAVLDGVVGWCYERNDERGPCNWLGDRADDARLWLMRRAADRRPDTPTVEVES
jgi:hypothetical protein